MRTDVQGALALLVMALATYATRAGGVFLIGLAQVTPRLERIFYFLSGSVIAALVAPSIAAGDLFRVLGVAAACLAMVGTRRTLLSLAVGVFTAALLRFFVQGV